MPHHTCNYSFSNYLQNFQLKDLKREHETILEDKEEEHQNEIQQHMKDHEKRVTGMYIGQGANVSRVLFKLILSNYYTNSGYFDLI